MNKAIAISSDFETLVEEFYPMLFRFGFILSGNPRDAIDYTQRTFRLLQENGHRIRRTSKVKIWLFATLYREVLKKRPRTLKRVETELDNVAIERVDRETRNGSEIGPEAVVAALQRLNQNTIAPLTMFYAGEFTSKEIAEALSLPIDTVMSRLYRGMTQLKRFLSVPQDRNARDYA